MKKLSYLMALVIIAFSFNVNAKIQQNNADINKSLNVTDYPAAMYNIPVQLNHNTKSAQSQTLNFVTIDQYRTSLWNHLSACSPIAWDPVSGAYFVVGMERAFDQTTFALIKAKIRIASSMNGQQWDTTTVFDIDDWGGFFPSIAVTNYASANNVAQIPFTIFAQAALKTGTDWPWSGGLLVAGTLGGGEPYIDNPQGPESNNPSTGQKWEAMKLKSYVLDGDAYVMGAGILSPSSEAYQYGNYGVFGWYPNDESVVVSNMPPQWTDSHFRSAPARTSSYQAPMEFDFDNNGLLYGAVNNMFADDPDNRVPAVSVSEDLGATWTDFNRMPVSLITTYASNLGFDSFMPVGVYDMNAFVATGENEFSYFLKFGLYNEGDSTFSEIDIVEAYYKNNAWGMRKIAEVQGTPQVLTWSHDFSTQDHYVYKIQDDPIGNEIQAVKTADGSKILLKWTDLTMSFDINPPHEITFDQQQQDGSTQEVKTTIDQTYTTDVFTCYRDVTSDTWTAPVNNTSDSSFQKATWLPNVIADVHHVPMTVHRTPIVTNQQHPAYGLPVSLNMQVADLFPYVDFTIFDADKGATAVEETTTSINSLNDAYPNPANDISEISFTIERASNIKLALYNSMGQLVKVLVNGFQPSGVHTYNLNVNDLSSGTYYYTLTTGNNTLSKMLNVVK